jgi:hypothetical protein
VSRSDYLSQHFNEWLDRYAPPRHLADKPDALQAEANDLLRIIGNHAPANGYAEWLDAVLRRLTSTMTARAWPAGGELTKACRAEHQASPGKPVLPQAAIDPAEMAARRMAAGQPVGESWLYGIGACELAARGLVEREVMMHYRSLAFLRRRDVHSEDAALEWERDAKERHEHAKALWKSREDQRQSRDVSRFMPRSDRSAA